MNKKKLFLWSLYDFANSFVFVNFLLYFSQWLVIDGGLHDFWYNAIFAITTIVLLVTAPILASRTDIRGGRKFWLNISTIGTFVMYFSSVLLAYFAPEYIFLIAVLFGCGQYFYQLSFVFYNPLIEEIGDEKHRSRISGIGQFSNALGQTLGIVATLSLAYSRLLPLFLALVIFIILSLPMMVLFKESKTNSDKSVLSSVQEEIKLYIRKLMVFFSVSVAVPMLVAFFFFNDALITLTNNYSIFLERVFGMPDESKSLLLVAILVMSAVGGFVSGWLGDKIGVLKILKIILISWIILLPLMAISPSVLWISVLTILAGLFMGGIWTVTRAYLSLLLKKEELGYGFSFYTLAERFSTFMGPLAWGGVIFFLGTEVYAYRISLIVLTIFVAIGFIVLQIWKRNRADLVNL